MKKVFFVYEPTTDPYGGVNSFNRALRKAMRRMPELGFEPAQAISQANLVFLSAASRGPGYSGRDRHIASWQLRNLVNGRFLFDPRGAFSHSGTNTLPLVHRLDGLTARYGRPEGETYDDLQKELNRLAARTVFQSQFCLDSFRNGAAGPQDTIILNGVDGDLFPTRPRHSSSSVLKLISASWSDNPAKGHNASALLSELPGVHMTFMGRWPETLDKKNVHIIPPQRQEVMSSYYHQADGFVHMASNDPSPNVVTEALATGLPVLYLDSGGTREIIRGTQFGVPIQKIALSDLQAGVNILTSRLNDLQEVVMAHRQNFLIEHSYHQYAAAFRSLV